MKEILNLIEMCGIMPLVTPEKPEDIRIVGEVLRRCNLPIVEITFRTSAAEQAIRILSNEYSELLVGAGTILTVEDAHRASDAGAQFILSPGLDAQIVKFAQKKGFPIFPGCGTATDLTAANTMGLEVVKIFPAETIGGVPALKAFSGPFGKMKYIATGGINDNNIAEYMYMPKVISCGGSWLLDKAKIEAKDVEGLVNNLDQSIYAMLGITFAHVEIPTVTEELETFFSCIMGKSNSMDFIGKGFKLFHKADSIGKGHLVFSTYNLKRTIHYLKRKGIPYHKGMNQSENSVYLEKEIAGFVIYIIEQS